MSEDLLAQRLLLEEAWKKFIVQQPARDIRGEVLSSWQRSALHIPFERVQAPVEDPESALQEWQDSVLSRAAAPLLPHLKSVAEDGDFVVAMSDAEGKLMWTYGSQRMTKYANQVNFVPGGRWDEASVGTNALDLALRTLRPAKVFSAEHYVQSIHDWVCYSAPIRHPHTGSALGVLDFSTTWQDAHPLALVTVTHLASAIEKELAGGLLGSAPAAARFSMNVCGSCVVKQEGKNIHLSPRQSEILLILALNPHGLTLDGLYTHLYGDQKVSFSTLKAEISVLRNLLGGIINSRPYRLNETVDLDAKRIERYLETGQCMNAVREYSGPVLPYSESPFISEWREYLDHAVREAALQSRSVEVLWAYLFRCPEDFEVIVLLASLMPPHDPRFAMVQARAKVHKM